MSCEPDLAKMLIFSCLEALLNEDYRTVKPKVKPKKDQSPAEIKQKRKEPIKKEPVTQRRQNGRGTFSRVDTGRVSINLAIPLSKILV